MINIKPNKNIVEVNTTSKKPIRYLKLYSNMSQEKQGRYLTAFELVDVTFKAV